MKIGSLFTGYGGLDMAAEAVTGGRTVWVADIEPAVCRLLNYRYPDVPNLGDVSAVDWSTVEPVDVLTGGFPCQDLSHAGKRAGMQRGVNRSGQWGAMCRAINTLRPELVVIENVRGLLSADADSDVEPCPWCLGDGPSEPPLRALGAVLADLAGIGYDASWRGLRAADVGAPHGRFRVFITATDTDSAASRQRRIAAPGQAESGRARADTGRRSGTPATDARSVGRDRGAGTTGNWRYASVRSETFDTPGDGATPPTSDAGRYALWQQPSDQPRRDGAPVAGVPRAHVAADADRGGQQSVRRVQPVPCDTDGRSGADTAWGDYQPAIRRWEHATGRVAPAPTDTAPRGAQRLSPRFVEWMMGLPAGWVTDVPSITRNEQLKMLGNGVVPQQAAAAFIHLLAATEAAA